MEQNDTNTTSSIELPEELRPIKRGELRVAPRQIEVPESVVAFSEAKRVEAAEAATARRAEAQEIAAKIGEGAVAVGLPDTNPYKTDSEQ
jgi:regulator of protease activity HflC (stomatin/prohibitin superfamily)